MDWWFDVDVVDCLCSAALFDGEEQQWMPLIRNTAARLSRLDPAVHELVFHVDAPTMKDQHARLVRDALLLEVDTWPVHDGAEHLFDGLIGLGLVRGFRRYLGAGPD